MNIMENLSKNNFPNPKDEDWKYIRLNALINTHFDLPTSAPVIKKQKINDSLLSDEHLLVFVNGLFNSELSKFDPNETGLTIQLLDKSYRGTSENSAFSVIPAEAGIQSYREVLDSRLRGNDSMEKNPLTSLNTAFSQQGVFVRLSKEVKLITPIHILYISLSHGINSMAHPRILLVAEENSQATLLETYSGEPDSVYWNNGVTRVFLEEGAQIDHYKIQNEGIHAFHTSSLQVHQKNKSTFTSNSFSSGGLLSRHHINSELNGINANCTFNGLYLARSDQQVDFHTRIDHKKTHGKSKITFKGILDDQARGVFNGKVIVHREAQKTDAYQSNKNLLLSANAEVDPKPELEIYADDVKCSHGATVGQLDENTLFYLKSRGIPEKIARNLLTYAFAYEILNLFSHSEIKKKAETILNTFMPIETPTKEVA